MPAESTLLLPRWIAPVTPGNPVLHDHAVLIEGERIAAVLPRARALTDHPSARRHELPGHLLVPGFVNLHTHAAMSLMRGFADDLPLERWLKERIWPAEGRFVDAEFSYDGALLGCAEMLLRGTTCLNDMYFFPEATLRASGALGMRAAVGMIVIDFPSRYGGGPEDYLRKGLALRDAERDNPLASFCLAPHAPYTVSDDALRRIATLADELQLPVHMHLHETAGEVAEALARDGRRPLRRMADLGLLGPGLIAVHAVHLDDTDIAMLAAHGASVAHCPHSNLKLGSGIAPVARLLAAGVNLGIGTDGSASNNRLDTLQEARSASLLAKGASGDPTCLDAARTLEALTMGGARALGLDHLIGSIEVGKAADLVAVDLDAPELQPLYDPISQLVYAADGRHIRHVWVAGRHVVCDQQLRDSAAKTAVSEVVARLPLWQNRFSDIVH